VQKIALIKKLKSNSFLVLKTLISFSNKTPLNSFIITKDGKIFPKVIHRKFFLKIAETKNTLFKKSVLRNFHFVKIN